VLSKFDRDFRTRSLTCRPDSIVSYEILTYLSDEDQPRKSRFT